MVRNLILISLACVTAIAASAIVNASTSPGSGASALREHVASQPSPFGPDAATPVPPAVTVPAQPPQQTPVSPAEAEHPPALPALEFSELAIRIAEYLGGYATAQPPTVDEWVAWVDLGGLTAAEFSPARTRLRRVPTNMLPAVLDEVVGAGTDNPHLLQLLWEPFLRLQGTSLDALAGELRVAHGLPPIRHTFRRTTCTSDQFEHGSTHAAVIDDPQAMVDVAVAEIDDHGPADVRTALELMRQGGGRVEYRPDVLRADIVAMRLGSSLVVGDRWVQHAAADPAALHGNLAHELGGHLFYGRPLACLIALHAFEPGEVPGFGSFTELSLHFGYPETEVYAELKELPHANGASLGDDPAADVVRQVRALRSAFPDSLSGLLLEWMDFRFRLDTTIGPEALHLFRTAVAS